MDETKSRARDHDGEGSELTKETRSNASIVVGSAGMKSDKSPIAVILLVSFSLYLV